MTDIWVSPSWASLRLVILCLLISRHLVRELGRRRQLSLSLVRA